MTISDLYTIMPIVITAGAALFVLLCGPMLLSASLTAIGVTASAAAGLWAALGTPASTQAVSGLCFTPLARFLIPVFCFAAAVTLLLSHSYNERRGIKGEEFPATVLFALFALCVLPCATNMLILFLALESVSFAFYILVSMDLNRAESGEAGLKYLLMGAVAAAFTAFGFALLFTGSGTLQLSGALARPDNRAIISAGWGVILVGMAFKLSLVPGHLWTPDVYQGAPAPVSAFLSTSSKVAAAALLLILLALFPPMPELRVPLAALSVLSMVLGNLAALLQQNIKRMLAYSSVAHMGYLSLALLSGSRDGYAAVLLYGAVYTAMNLAAFGAISSLSIDEERELVTDYAGLGFTAPLRGGVLALAMISLAGIPPTAGFIGKFFIFYSAIKGGSIALAIIGILSAAASAYFYLRVVAQLYMHRSQAPAPRAVSLAEGLALCLASAMILVIGVYPGPLLKAIDTALQ
ncbi:NADH-quinone oxidoreductase subunit N [Geomonas sp. Red69]|uniref:NADH-quinone oxidoreductase subunit N n=1 Tax=Geomonas diazotrophica TaxID=2843197 RepID=UPI001C104F7C|nr:MULTISPECIES: NADH-quinone oxidoreductase subunit N [Geomonas]MBU5635410.1 NADH-quinone oxidoreductase subunit N [Geomonas diazotrophica]QXE86676.1 NADH-quinone oxidoreductase subunit N [Geomonas nitrogeniifigens]